MASTYEKIATTTLGSAAADVTFSSISSAYTDLVIIINGTFSAGENSYGMRLNGDTSSAYSSTAVYGTSSSSASLRQSNVTRMYLGRTSTANGTSIIHLQNYSNTTTYKTALSRGNSDSTVMATVSLWRSTSAVNSITIAQYDFGATNLGAGSTFTLYGILKA